MCSSDYSDSLCKQWPAGYFYEFAFYPNFGWEQSNLRAEARLARLNTSPLGRHGADALAWR